MDNLREKIKDKQRIVIKIGSSSLMHDETDRLNLLKNREISKNIG